MTSASFSTGCHLSMRGMPKRSSVTQIHRRGMHITTADTPNLNSLMFRPGKDVMGEFGGTVSFPDAATARQLGSVLATRLFEVAGVDKVFFGPDFVSVTKEEER